MGGKKRKLAHIRPQPESHRRNSKPLPKPSKPQQPKKKQEHVQNHHEEPTIPFSPTDRILLLGEGDLSFAASLITHHACLNVTATVLEKSEQEVLDKYPHAAANIEAITKPPPKKDNEDADEEDVKIIRNKLVYGIDATKPLPKSVAHPPPHRIIFNFPHVGGKSTDVNRQVRYNQSLLVALFHHTLPLLPPGGTIIVTLFEGEPYTLWNVRDLARHAGLQVERSFKFQPAAYPGYHHARTLGVVKNRKGGEAVGGWRGEERASRSFVFVRKGDVPQPFASKKKRRRNDDSDSEPESDVPYDSDSD